MVIEASLSWTTIKIPDAVQTRSETKRYSLTTSHSYAKLCRMRVVYDVEQPRRLATDSQVFTEAIRTGLDVNVADPTTATGLNGLGSETLGMIIGSESHEVAKGMHKDC